MILTHTRLATAARVVEQANRDRPDLGAAAWRAVKEGTLTDYDWHYEDGMLQVESASTFGLDYHVDGETLTCDCPARKTCKHVGAWMLLKVLSVAHVPTGTHAPKAQPAPRARVSDDRFAEMTAGVDDLF